jgi:tyrosyl-tRNA synthetase
MSFVDELKWRGMLHDIMPGTEELLKKEQVSGYIGFDPTADSLGLGNLVQIMTLVHFQRSGHSPVALVGGATGMVGDPSGKSAERNLLDRDTLVHNQECQQKQLEKFLDFSSGKNKARIVNNYDWFKDMGFLDFIRDVGKHITINYMLAKDSVKTRLESGMSFTEFSYQLVQGYDFYYLWKNHGVKMQMGGSDQWGNILTGTELIRRKDAGEAFALTTPLIKKADGSKFGKTESGNIWLDPEKTSPYKFYQFWINASDQDVENYIRIFSLNGREEIESLISDHAKEPHLRLLQKSLAAEITARVHSADALAKAQDASEILFGKGTREMLGTLSEKQILEVFEGVPTYNLPKSELEAGIPLIELLVAKSTVFPSKGEARKMIQQGGVLINKEKADDVNLSVNTSHLLSGNSILVQKGKKNYFLFRIQ